MVKYSFINDSFVIDDYQSAKTFSSFLPAIAGERGKPLWLFYANVGQCVGGFGVNNRHTPITPFDSATLAYQNIPLKGFRTFIRESGELYEAFKDTTNPQQMVINKTSFSISEKHPFYEISVNYKTVSNQPFAALVREVTFTNPTDEERTYEIIDGLPIFLPYGLDNNDYKELVSLMRAYCEIHNLGENAPFVKFKTATGDNPVVTEKEEGNGFYSFKIVNGKIVANKAIVDPDIIFDNDTALLTPKAYKNHTYGELINAEQQQENIIPCAFSMDKITIAAHTSVTYYTLYGSFMSHKEFEKYVTKNEKLIEIVKNDEAYNIVNDLLKSVDVKTSDPLFDNYVKQTYLDNNLRGGFPTLIGNQPYYIYSRKHGDMERDYNFFDIPSKYYSSGSCNFRDVNQNRRNDLYYAPYLDDYNIYTFFSLIQADGQNPLTVKPNLFHINSDFNFDTLNQYPCKKELVSLLKSYEPSDLYTLLDKYNLTNVFEELISNSYQTSEGCFSEGYWIDHWTYNVDLLENYEAIYPDRIHELLFNPKYTYFHSLIYVLPRDEKYSLLPSGKIRQYGAIDLEATRKEAHDKKYDMKETHWLEDRSGNRIYTTLVSKIFNLILIKFSTLDSRQLGIEMECEKPGWNDAMNGLPGLFASSMCETVELLRLVRFLSRSLVNEKDGSITILREQYQFYRGVSKYLRLLSSGQISQFDYWDNVASLRESYRAKIHYNVSGLTNDVSVKQVLSFLKSVDKLLTKGIDEGKVIGCGILPSYLIYNVTKYELTEKVSHYGLETIRVKEFELETLPPFLEASARMFKLGKGIAHKQDYQLIKESDLYDKTLHIYKTCANIESAPFEIGRVHAFTKGWLERECNFLHMTYKYLLGLLKAGYYQEFYQEIKTNFVCYMDPYVYGRSPIENVSFIVPTCNPDKKRHGQGYFARLTGANAELLNMINIMFIGEHPFTYIDGELSFNLEPKLPASFFDNQDKVSYMFLSKTRITYHNPKRLNTYQKNVKFIYHIDNHEYHHVPSEVATKIRNGEYSSIEVEVTNDEG